MSLVGSLEDLGLGEILQIISLSRKSGVLILRSDQGEGWIRFRDGRVTGAFLKGGPADLRGLLVSAGALEAEAYDAAAGEAAEAGVPVERRLAERGVLSRETLARLRREHLERTAQRMFAWPSGEFSFDVRDDLDAADPALDVEGGIDAQYLAMEGARLHDEAGREGEETAADLPDLDAALAAPRVPAPPAEPPPLVVIDASLAALEWVKASLAGRWPRVHIFQRTELGIARIRQYLARSEVPLVLLAADAPPDPISGASSPAEIIRRLKAQAPRMAILELAEPGRGGRLAGADGSVEKARAEELGSRRRAERLAARAEALVAALGRSLGGGAPGEPGRG